MPLTCENVAAWANTFGGVNGDLASPALLHFNPSNIIMMTAETSLAAAFCMTFAFLEIPKANV